MFEHPPLRRDSSAPEPIDLGIATPTWQPVIARDLRPIGFRVTLRRSDAAAGPVPMTALLDGVLAGFVAEGATSFPHGLVVLAPLDFTADETLARWSAPRNVLLEFGQHELDDPARLRLLFDVQRHGVRLALRVEDRNAILRERLPIFQYLLADALAFGAAPRETALLAFNGDSRAAAEAAFNAGAHAVVGWPLAEPMTTGAGSLQPQQAAVLELIRLAQSDSTVGALERAFKREPVLGYMLLTLANSPAFLRTSPIASLGQAIQLLGYKRLVKWLVLLLVVASKDAKALPHIYAACARGFCMENIAAAAGAPGVERDNCFVVGVFSLLDRITGRSMHQLFEDVALPEAVMDAVVHRTGCYAPYLDLVIAFEGAATQAIAARAAALQMSPAIAHAALLQALAATDALQSVV